MNQLHDLTINFLKERIVMELESYDNLPLHLAYLYLLYKPEGAIYFLNWKITLVKEPVQKEDSKIVVSDINNPAKILTGFAELFKNLFLNYKNSPTIKTKLQAIYKEGFEDLQINTKFALQPAASQKTGIIYSRNKELKESLKKLTMILNERTGQVGFHLAIPILYLFRGSTCIIEYQGRHLKQEEVLITYDNQNHTLKQKVGTFMNKNDPHQIAYNIYDSGSLNFSYNASVFSNNYKVRINSW